MNLNFLKYGQQTEQKTKTVRQVLYYLDEFYKINGPEKGYIVNIKYLLARQKENKDQTPGVRTYKVEGNYYEVKSYIIDWAKDIAEIYNEKDFHDILCLQTLYRVGILINRKNSKSQKIVLYQNYNYSCTRYSYLYSAIVCTIYEKIRTDDVKAFTYFKVSEEEKYNRKELIEKVYGILYPYLKRSKKLKEKYNINIGSDVINVIDGFDMSKAYPDRINIFQADRGYYSFIKTGIQVDPEEQRPIMESRKVFNSDAQIVAFDFEFDWNRLDKDTLINTLPKIITVEVYRFKDNFKESKMFRGDSCRKDFLNYIFNISDYAKSRMNVTTYCISHNASSVEHILILNMLCMEYIINENYTINLNHVDSTKIHSFSFKGVEFRDSYLFYPSSLKKFAEDMEVKTQKSNIEIDYENMKWDNATDEQLDYCVRDSKALLESLIKFNELMNYVFQGYGLFYFSYKSLGSVAKYNYIENNPDLMFSGLFNSLNMHNYYFGGRCEAFYIGNNKRMIDDLNQEKSWIEKFLKGNKKISAYKISRDVVAYKIDINSSYPDAMRKNIPGKMTRQFKDLKECDFENKLYFISCYIKYKRTYWNKFKKGLVPIKDNDGKIIFPDFIDFNHVLLYDFEYLTIKDYIEIKIDTIIEFDKNTYFKDKVERIYDERIKSKKENKKSLEKVLKLTMNSAYGSLALKNERSSIILTKGVHTDKVKDRYITYIEYDLDNKLIKGWNMFEIKDLKDVNSIIQQAMYITSLGRFKLWEAIEELERKGYICIYCDTDSIIFIDIKERKEEEVLKSIDYMINPNKLGMWKYEGCTNNWSIQGLKYYIFGKEIKCKGVKNPTIKNNYIESRQKIRVWGRLREGYIVIKNVTKNLSFKYTKGMVDLSTGFINPLER